MLKKLRVKFIAVTMAMVAAVLIIAFTTICFTEYQRSLSTLENALTSTVERSAETADRETYSQDPLESNVQQEQSGASSFESAASSGGPDKHGERLQRRQSSANSGPQIGGREPDREQQFPIATFTIDGNGELQPIAEATTAYLSDEVLESISPKIAIAADGFSYDEGTALHYVKRTIRGTVYIAFADDTNVSSWKSLAITLLLVGLGTLIVFFFISLFLSKWALKPVDEAWKAQRQFVTDASHELKTPLTVILANTSILLKHPEHSIASESKWLESTQVEAQNMEGLVTEMLTLALVEAKPSAHREPIDLSDLVNGQVLQFESVAFEQGFELEGTVADNVVIWGDRDRIRKLVSTLIENASKYVNPGGTVSVTLAATDKVATYTVFNSGSFIAAEDLPHVFDRFYRTDKARTDGVGGFGLGLAIAREIARDHHGDIIAKSDPATGTTFEATVSLRS